MIRKKKPKAKDVIDLTGPSGNAFTLIMLAKKTGKQLGWPKEKISSMIDEMTRGDYEELIQTFDKYFGDRFILER